MASSTLVLPTPLSPASTEGPGDRPSVIVGWFRKSMSSKRSTYMRPSAAPVHGSRHGSESWRFAPKTWNGSHDKPAGCAVEDHGTAAVVGAGGRGGRVIGTSGTSSAR